MKKQTNTKIKLDENGEVVGFLSSSVGSASKKYESSCFAKALFTYKDGDIKSVSKQSNAYTIKTKTNASTVASLVLNNVDNPVVEKVLRKDLPNTESDSTVKVTYNGNKISSYEYTFEVSVSAVTLTIKYTINFAKVNEAPKIELKDFKNLYVTESDINARLDIVNNAINKYKTKPVSSNEFELNTDVDFGVATNGIGAKFVGESKRSNKSGKIDFINLIKVDSDLKNEDLYKSKGLEDINYVRGNLSNGKTFDRKKGLLKYDDPVETNVSARKDMDNYFLLLDNSFFNANNVNSVSVSASSGVSKYSLTLSNDGVSALFDFVNNVATLNPFITEKIKVLGDYDKNTLNLKSAKFTVEIDNSTNTLASISISLKAKSDVKYTNSRDFSSFDNATVKIDYSFTVTSNVTSYSAPSDAKDLKY